MGHHQDEQGRGHAVFGGLVTGHPICTYRAQHVPTYGSPGFRRWKWDDGMLAHIELPTV